MELPIIDVIGVAPIGEPQPLAKAPAGVSALKSEDLEQTGASGLAGALERRLPSVAITEASGNSLQQSLSYRGFEASPVEGTPQGVAVYQNGVRLNEAFGDTVNWDFVPLSAVGRVEVGGNNPAFGLNALGGAVRLKMKDGFTWQGTEIEAMGGSYGRLAGSFQHGRRIGDAAAYFAIEGLRDQGFRRSSASAIRRFYGDVGLKIDTGEVHLNIAAADNVFGASAAAPLELLRRDWAAIYTTPQTTRQQMGLVNLTADLRPAPNWSVAANAYMRGLLRRHVDGNTTEVEACGGGALLCFDDPGTPANGRDGAQLANIFGDAQLGQIDRTRTSSRAFGASLQATNTDRLFGLGNSVRFGLSVDHAQTRFTASSELGV
ncbi:MAG TPA: Plug domain-containing protein, partial [Beijerinckiaceae bacterium]